MNTYRLYGTYGKLSDEHISAVWKLTEICRMNTYRLYGNYMNLSDEHYIGCMEAYGKLSDEHISAVWNLRKLSDEHISAVWKLTGNCRMNTYRLCRIST